jgi:F-type H+-transporting ATPase subunit b
MGFNGWTFLFEAVNFVVLAYVLHRLLYRPLREAVERRRAATGKAQADAEQARLDAEALRKRLEAQLSEVERQRQEAIHQAREEAASERKKLLAETDRALQQRLEESRQAIQQEREEALAALRSDVIAQAVELTRRLLSEASDRTLHRQLALHLVQTLQDLPEPERTALRVEWQTEDGGLLEAACEPDGATLEQIAGAVAGIADKPIPLTVKVRPELLDGVRLRVGGQVWDSSLSAPLQEASQAHARNGTP